MKPNALNSGVGVQESVVVDGAEISETGTTVHVVLLVDDTLLQVQRQFVTRLGAVLGSPSVCGVCGPCSTTPSRTASARHRSRLLSARICSGVESCLSTRQRRASSPFSRCQGGRAWLLTMTVPTHRGSARQRS